MGINEQTSVKVYIRVSAHIFLQVHFFSCFNFKNALAEIFEYYGVKWLEIHDKKKEKCFTWLYLFNQFL